MSDYKKLHAAVIEASNSKDWNIAKLEREFISAYRANFQPNRNIQASLEI